MFIEDYDGSCIIVWPKKQPGLTALPTWPMRVIDARTGEDMDSVTGVSIHLGGREWVNTAITAQVTGLVNDQGTLLRAGQTPVWEDPEADELKPKMGEYLYLVTEMKVGE